MELSKVNWPTRSQLIQYTLIVVGLSFAIAIFLGGVDFVLKWLLTKFVIK